VTSAVIFSKDRAAQLDLCLRSIKENAAGFVNDVVVLWKASHRDHEKGYNLCRADHPDVMFIRESDFWNDTLAIVNNGYLNETAMFVMDDDVIYRPVVAPYPEDVLELNGRAICFSLRLGANTTECYPLRRSQGQPHITFSPVGEGQYGTWDWMASDADFGYPGSLDGHVFRTPELAMMLEGATFSNPNQLEEALVSSTRHMLAPTMCGYRLSHLVGIPANRVSDTHHTNRYGETNYEPETLLNRTYLDGSRITLDSVDPRKVNAAHVEFPLVFV